MCTIALIHKTTKEKIYIAILILLKKKILLKKEDITKKA